MKIPKIGIPFWQIGDNSMGVTIPYLHFIQEFGQIVLLNPLVKNEEDVNLNVDLVIIPGGADINSLRYDETPGLFTSKPDIYKEYFDLYSVPVYIKNNIPLFGICRGFQSLSIMFGGKLTQHMYHETSEKYRSDLVHSLTIDSDFIQEMRDFNTNLEEDSELYNRIYHAYQNPFITLPTFSTKNPYEVNSLHHQAIDLTEDSPLQPLAFYRGKMVKEFVEVILHESLPIAGVQYHPEELSDDAIVKYLMFKLLYHI